MKGSCQPSSHIRVDVLGPGQDAHVMMKKSHDDPIVPWNPSGPGSPGSASSYEPLQCKLEACHAAVFSGIKFK